MTRLETLAAACRMLHAQGHMTSLAGQITARDESGRGYWTPALGTRFGAATAASMLRVDDELNVLEGDGVPNPAVRSHACVYRARPDVQAIVHTHPVHVSAVSMPAIPLPMANHGHVCAASGIEEGTYLAVSMEHAAEAVLKAMAADAVKPVPPVLAQTAHDFLLQPANRPADIFSTGFPKLRRRPPRGRSMASRRRTAAPGAIKPAPPGCQPVPADST